MIIREEVRHFDEMQFTVVMKVFSHHADFFGHKIQGCEVDLRTMEDGARLYGVDHSADLPEVPFFHGSVEWHGCSNWVFDEQYNGYMHGCSRKHLIHLGAILAACWDMAAESIPAFDREVAEA